MFSLLTGRAFAVKVRRAEMHTRILAYYSVLKRRAVPARAVFFPHILLSALVRVGRKGVFFHSVLQIAFFLHISGQLIQNDFMNVVFC